MSSLAQPQFWLVASLEWPDAATGTYAECAFAVAPTFVPRGLLSPAADAVLELARGLYRPADGKIMMFSELAQKLGRLGHDWVDIGVDDWEATMAEISAAPIPSLFLTLSRFAHTLLCMAGKPDVTIYSPDGKRELTAADYDPFRAQLETLLARDWAEFIYQMEREGKFRPVP
jgi:hypothetical protein